MCVRVWVYVCACVLDYSSICGLFVIQIMRYTRTFTAGHQLLWPVFKYVSPILAANCDSGSGWGLLAVGRQFGQPANVAVNVQIVR